MKLKHIAATLAAATALLGTSAFAAGPSNAEFYPFAEIMSMKMMDKNGDGLVSKKEFLDMMGMAWDMNVKKMGAKGALTPDQMKEIMMYLKAGG